MFKEYAPKEKVFNRYIIEKVIGRGGMQSVIYLVTDLLVNENDKFRKKVIKVIEKNKNVSDDDWIKFHDEIITMFRLNSEKIDQSGIARIFDCKFENNRYCIIMEYAEGKNLRQVISDTKTGALTVIESLYIIKSILQTLKEIHSAFKQIIIHRDLKPENIILSNDRLAIKIIDFGISSSFYKRENNNRDGMRVSNTSTKKQLPNLTHTTEKEIYGTYAYLTPWILEAKGKNLVERNELIRTIGIQFDLYALGVMLYEMIMGTKPFASDDEETTTIFKDSEKYDIKPISTIKPFIPTAVENVIIRLMASKEIKNKKNKHLVKMYESAEEALNDVNKIITHYEKNENVPEEKLLLDPNERIYQNKIGKILVKLKTKWYEKWWVIVSITFLSILIVFTIWYVF